MYQIYSDNICIHSDVSPDSSLKAVGTKLSLAAGAAGSLNFTLPKPNIGYDSVERLTSTLRVEQDGNVIWMGRVLSEKRDMWGSRELFAEGALAYLNDTIPMIANPSIASVLTAHNSKVAQNRQITFDSSDSRNMQTIVADADGSSSLGVINKIVDEYGGILKIEFAYDISEQIWVPKLVWLADYETNPNAQAIEFGKNLLDFTRNWDMADYATYCFVRGAEIEGSEPKAYYSSGWQYLSPASGTAPKDIYGRIEVYLDYSDLQSNADCVSAAQTYLQKQQFAGMTLELSAVDLHMIDPNIQPFHLLEKVPVRSPLHGVNMDFAVTNLDINIDSPASGGTSYSLNDAEMPYKRKVNKITKVTQQVQQNAQTYADSAASEALSDANRNTESVRVVLAAKDTEIEASVTAADGRASEAKMTADEIKAKVTDAQGNYTVANLKADGFHVADASGVTKITGSMIDVDTIRVNSLYGNIIYLRNNDQGGTVAGSFYTEGGGFNPSILQINFQTVWIAQGGSVYLPDPNFVYVSYNGGYVSLAALLGI